MTSNKKGLDFEKKCFDKLVEIGFSALSLTKNTDNGADIVGTYNGLIYVFQCKNHEKKQGNKCVQEIIAAQRLYKANRSVVISNSAFTAAAIELAKANNCILIISSSFFSLNVFPPANYTEVFKQNEEVYDINYNLVERYEEARRSIGRTPKWAELDKNLRYRIRKEYRNYGCFLQSIGDQKYSEKPSVPELKQEYLRIRSIIGKVPTLSDIKNHSQYAVNSFHEYPFTRLQKECGDRPNVERGITKAQLTEAYLSLQEKLKHPPTVKEIDSLCEYRASYYRRQWGSMDLFFESLGKSRAEAGLSRRYSKEEIITIYSLLKILLSVVNETHNYDINHTVLEQLKYGEKCLISPSTISKKFGSWKAFLQYLEDNEIDASLTELVEQLNKFGIDYLIKK